MKNLSTVSGTLQKSMLTCIFTLTLAWAGPQAVCAQDVPSDNLECNEDTLLTPTDDNDAYQLDKEEKRQEAVWNDRSRYFHFGYLNQTLTHQDVPGLNWKSDFGFSIGAGRTFYLHKKPLFNMLKFGLDATWFDLSYAKYGDAEGWVKLPSEPVYPDEGYEEEEIDLGVHQLELGMHVGPSITLNPVDHLKLSGYFHFIPSASVVIMNDEANVNYVSNFAVGGAIAYKVISLGVESRWGKAKYNSFSIDEEGDDSDWEGDVDIDDVLKSSKNRLKTKSIRFFLIFRY